MLIESISPGVCNDYVEEGRALAPKARQSDFDNHNDCHELLRMLLNEGRRASASIPAEQRLRSIILAEPGSG